LNSSDAALAKARNQARLRRGMFILPSFFTALNIGAGYFAITQTIAAISGNAMANRSLTHLDLAAIAILIAIPFDSLDGRIARMTNTTSDFGRELDSLADVITFGVAPSLLAYLWGFRMLPEMQHPEMREQLMHVGVFVCFIFLICGASRLARFNISINPQPRNPGRPGKKYFVGMPIPAGAGVISSVIHLQRGSPIYNPWISLVWLCLLLGTSFLMVSNWRFWSAKEITSGSRHPFQLVAVIAVIGALIVLYHQYMLFLLAMAYVVSGVVARLAYSWSRGRRQSPVESQR